MWRTISCIEYSFTSVNQLLWWGSCILDEESPCRTHIIKEGCTHTLIGLPHQYINPTTAIIHIKTCHVLGLTFKRMQYQDKYFEMVVVTTNPSSVCWPKLNLYDKDGMKNFNQKIVCGGGRGTGLRFGKRSSNTVLGGYHNLTQLF